MTPTTTRFFDAVQTLDVNGYQHLAGACISFYDRQTYGMTCEQRSQVAAMFDEVLTKELGAQDGIHATEIILSLDFVFLKALARTLQELELAGDQVIDLAEFEIVEGEIIPPPG
jgi:hypothetical protein